MVLEGVDSRETLERILKTYPADVPPEEWEIRVAPRALSNLP